MSSFNNKQVLISFLFPIYNEEKRILKTLKFIEFCKKNFKSYNFIYLLNNCNDNTKLLIKKHIKNKNVGIIESKYSSRGSGLKLSFKKIKTENFAVCSVDNAWGFNFYKKAFNSILENKYDVIYGTKSHKKSSIKRALYRKILSYLSKITLRILFPEMPRHDTQCIKVFKSTIPYLNILSNFNYFTDTEFAIYSKIFKLKTLELPVSVKITKYSKLNIIGILQFLLEAIYFRLKLIKFYIFK
jgi:hypothetical protein